ncbi:MAG: family 1 glycosylhydrolase [Candidatus Omnitrophica bacterium]|nr:family 1 glycosylhydrolase [Candidatus Omnitrophota bacterium]MDD5430575.1 family 1 glycosylhydrolase [Candidatus Omnitrophota bacterium]
MRIKFPPSFLWGAAISSYQCEGGNNSCDWFEWEKKRGLEPCGLACNHYNLFKKDFSLARKLNLNSLRFSLEWSRLCPEPNIFLEEELGHYIRVIEELSLQGLEPVVTLHHFTNPLWFARMQSFSRVKNIDHFLFYLRKTVQALKDKVNIWLIFNEPLVYIYNSYIEGIWPPGSKSLLSAKKVLDNVITAYCLGYEEINNIYKSGKTSPRISLSKNMRVFYPCDKGVKNLNSFSSQLRSQVFNFRLIEKLTKAGKIDFLALNYYCREFVRFKGPLGAVCGHGHDSRRNYLGWDIYPQGFYELLMSLKKYNLPVFVTENGTAESQETFYESYLVEHLRSLARAYEEGVDLMGYLWWSLLDNFEWDKGFGPRFGLIEVDYTNFNRKIKPFAYTYAKICRESEIDTKC